MFSWLLVRLALVGAALAGLVLIWFGLAGRLVPTRDQTAAMMTSGEIKRDRVGQGVETKCLKRR